MTPEQESMLRAIHQLLLGYNGSNGLYADYKDHKKNDVVFRAKFYSFRLAVIIALVLLGGGSGFSLAELLR
jgi:hypothetical protein